jgi:hypothetical protein
MRMRSNPSPKNLGSQSISVLGMMRSLLDPSRGASKLKIRACVVFALRYHLSLCRKNQRAGWLVGLNSFSVHYLHFYGHYQARKCVFPYHESLSVPLQTL